MTKHTTGVIEQINDVISRHCKPDRLTIGLLRYGAHLPHLCTTKTDRKVEFLLSHMVDFMPRNFFKGREIVLLDDTVYRGREIKRIAKHLRSEFGVPKTAIKSATVVVHARATVDPSHRYVVKYDDADYIEWKEELGRIVQRTLRPTDRDHPLYYFKLVNVQLPQLIAILRAISPIYSVGPEISGNTIRLSIPLPELADDPRLAVDGFTLQSLPKIRLYCKPRPDGLDLTFVPMMFGRLAINDFKSQAREHLAEQLGLRRSFFDDVLSSDVGNPERMLFFFVSRGVGSLLLRRFLDEQFVPRLHSRHLVSVRPEDRDGRVHYIFPKAYTEFHAAALAAMNRIAAQTAQPRDEKVEQAGLFEPVAARHPDSAEAMELAPRLLAFLADRCPPAEFSGSAWEPRADDTGDVEYADLLEPIDDRDSLSRVLDELLDCGLLRARDSRVSDTQPVYGRTYRCGGEYKAVEVLRIRDSYVCGDVEKYESLGAEERRALWGSDVL